MRGTWDGSQPVCQQAASALLPLSLHSAGIAEQGTEGENDLGKPEAQANTLPRKARQECGNSSGELPPQKTRGCGRHHQSPAPCDHREVLTPLAKVAEYYPHALLDLERDKSCLWPHSSAQMRNGDGISVSPSDRSDVPDEGHEREVLCISGRAIVLWSDLLNPSPPLPLPLIQYSPGAALQAWESS